MGRLPTVSRLLVRTSAQVGPRTPARVVGLVFVGLCSCRQESRSSPTRERSEVVEAPDSGAPAVALPPPSPGSTDGMGAGKLCEGQLARPGRELPRKNVSRKTATRGKASSPAAVTAASGKWTWVNLWAAWCAPCKEEMPRLRRFAARLTQAGKNIALAFVSVDDDERQLEDFLAAQATDALAETFWLREGRERDDWLAAAGLGRDPALPVQLLVDPKGKIRCVVRGAVADQDYPEIAAVVSAP